MYFCVCVCIEAYNKKNKKKTKLQRINGKQWFQKHVMGKSHAHKLKRFLQLTEFREQLLKEINEELQGNMSCQNTPNKPLPLTL